MSRSLQTYPIIVHSHLGWDWVWQRPQQFMTRLSPRHPVLYVEGPHLVDENIEPCFELQPATGYPNVTLLRMKFPAARFGDGDWVDHERFRLLHDALAGPLAHQFDRPVQWFYDPMAITAFGKLESAAIVYDCMDELSQFKFAPAELVKRERQLLAAADVVFAGGRRLHEAKSRHNDNCHFYGCGVDVAHFAAARSEKTVVPADIAALPGPVLGFFGVVDERLDYQLLAAVADANPSFTIAMIGPAVKIDPAALPQRRNIHWLGGRPYDQLPAYARKFDACIMPFALNEATEYINPTKALEYMATGRPIISTPVSDVVSNFGRVVTIAQSTADFSKACRRVVTYPDTVAIQRGLRMAELNTWDAIVAKLEGHLVDVLRQRAAPTERVATRLPVSVTAVQQSAAQA